MHGCHSRRSGLEPCLVLAGWLAGAQVLETKDEAVKDGLFEEAVILRRREVDYRAELAGPSEEGSTLPVVGQADIEAIVSSWTGIPVERMDGDEQARLLQLVRGGRGGERSRQLGKPACRTRSHSCLPFRSSLQQQPGFFSPCCFLLSAPAGLQASLLQPVL